MNIYILSSAQEYKDCRSLSLPVGMLSYIADGSHLRSEKIPDAPGSLMVVSADNASRYVAPSIYDECRRHGYTSVFLDSEEQNAELCEISASLIRRGLSVFCPFELSSFCDGAIPVVNAGISGGSFDEYILSLQRTNKRLALFIPRIMHSFSMPCTDGDGTSLSPRELSSIIYHHNAKSFYSPQLKLNYFIYPEGMQGAGYILFDDAHTINEKLRYAKKHGITHAFLAYRSISDIVQDIIF